MTRSTTRRTHTLQLGDTVTFLERGATLPVRTGTLVVIHRSATFGTSAAAYIAGYGLAAFNLGTAFEVALQPEEERAANFAVARRDYRALMASANPRWRTEDPDPDKSWGEYSGFRRMTDLGFYAAVLRAEQAGALAEKAGRLMRTTREALAVWSRTRPLTQPEQEAWEAAQARLQAAIGPVARPGAYYPIKALWRGQEARAVARLAKHYPPCRALGAAYGPGFRLSYDPAWETFTILGAGQGPAEPALDIGSPSGGADS